MKIVNRLKVLVLVGLSSSLSAFAGPKDLKIMNTLAKVGVGFENGMSHAYLGVENIECQYTFETAQVSCTMTDTAGDDGAGSLLVLKGKRANLIFNMLQDLGAPSDSAMGHHYISAQTILCSQVADGVTDGGLADRTNCTIILGQ